VDCSRPIRSGGHSPGTARAINGAYLRTFWNEYSFWGGVPEVAVALGVADTTVPTHVSRLFEKTGASRQADLVKIVAGYAAPLAG
jgi:hypothetical protein